MKNKQEFPSGYIKIMKKKKRKKMRNVPINDEVIEKKYNDAKQII